MVSSLPADLLLIICEVLGNKQDFGTLYNCARSGRILVNPALSWLYRVHNQSKSFSTDSAEGEWTKTSHTFQARREQQIQTITRWALLWKSIIRSSIDKTAYPYALYIHSLDLRNLTDLLEDTLFREHAMEEFFAGDMAQFLKAQETPLKKRTRGGKAIGMRLDIPVVLDLVGEAITSFVSESARENRATVALDDMAPGDISSSVLPRWTGRLSRLKSMTLWDCSVLNQELADAINNHCPSFNDVTFLWSRNDLDADLASFFGTLRSNSLESFTAISAQGIGPETLLALNNHSSSLKKLQLDDLRSEAIRNLSLLQGCVALESFALIDNDGIVDLELTENDVYLEIVAWLGRCERLRELSFKKLVSAPTILTQLCLNNNTRLRKLKVVGYPVVGNQDFHRALSHQTTLESLSLAADAESLFRDDIDTLVSSICQLGKLTDLDLCGTADYFRTPEIVRLASSLKSLETFTFSGYDVTDAIWPAISGLRNLRALTVQAVTSFSLDGILNYISALHLTNQGLNLSVLMQNGENDLTDEDKAIIQKDIKEKVDGEFVYMLFREVESDTESDSD